MTRQTMILQNNSTNRTGIMMIVIVQCIEYILILYGIWIELNWFKFSEDDNFVHHIINIGSSSQNITTRGEELDLVYVIYAFQLCPFYFEVSTKLHDVQVGLFINRAVRCSTSYLYKLWRRMMDYPIRNTKQNTKHISTLITEIYIMIPPW